MSSLRKHGYLASPVHHEELDNMSRTSRGRDMLYSAIFCRVEDFVDKDYHIEYSGVVLLDMRDPEPLGQCYPVH